MGVPDGADALSGVGAQVDRVSTGTSYKITGRHAPDSQVVVADSISSIVAAVLIDGRGDFAFDFVAAGSDLVIFGIDEAGVTASVALPVGGVENLLLPPTLVQDPAIDLGNDGVAIGGYSYPGANVTVTLTKSGGGAQSEVVVAESDGGWRLSLDKLQPGNYETVARSKVGPQESEPSQVLSFEILPPAAAVFANVGDAVGDVVRSVIPGNLSDAAAAVAPQAESLTQAVAPVVGAGLLTQLALAGREVFYWLLQGLFSLLQLFGLRKKHHPWGVVYDALTKQPLGWAIVRLYNVGQQIKLVATDVTGKGGVFSFFPQAGAYIMKVSKVGYNFPSRLILAGRDGEYDQIYHGEQVKFTGEESVVSVSVPVDPKKVVLDWKFRVIRLVRARVGLITTISLVVGFVMALVAVVGGQGKFNGILLLFYGGMIGFSGYMSYLNKRAWGVVVNQAGERVAGVELNLIDNVFARLVQRRLSSSDGRYQFVVPAGRYKIKVASVGWELVPEARGAYAGGEIVVSGEAPKLVALRVVVEGSRS